MPERTPRYRTDRPELDQQLVELLDAVNATANRDQLFEILVSALGLASDRDDRLDLKIANATLREMRSAFRMFAPYRQVPKVTIFGSARTLADDPLYLQTRDFARAIAERGWMVVTGAGPGIMAAGVEGAGRDHALGVNIRLPLEQVTSEFLAGDKLVAMKYFFTRKLMLMKESAGFVVLPGGFGTLDEAFELFTLTQTGKADPKPIVLLEVTGGTYWQAWERFMCEQVAARGFISTEDLSLFCTTDDAGAAVGELLGFYRNYHSLRWVGDRLVIRLRSRPTPEEVVMLNRRYADVCRSDGIAPAEPLPAEVATNDHLELPRLALYFDRLRFSRLHKLIRDLNELPSAPPAPADAAEIHTSDSEGR